MTQTDLIGTCCDRPPSFAWFLGAGASRTAGLPTATDIIWDLKRRYYCLEENQDISRQDLQNYAVQQRIQSFLDSRGFPPIWAENEYTTLFEKIFGEDRERQRKYIRAILSEDHLSLSIGNRVFAALLTARLCRIAFTTNFDTVVERSFAEVGGRSLSAYHIEGARAANAALNNEEYPLYCKLHGDFRYDSIKNLSQDLMRQNDQLADCLVTAGSRYGFIVSGYSGRDESVIRLFHRVLDSPNPFPHGLYWTILKGSPVHPSIPRLLDRARDLGVSAQLVETQTFDSFMLHLWRNLPERPKDLDVAVRKSRLSTVNIPLPDAGHGDPLLRLTALPIVSMPDRCYSLSFTEPKEWDDLRQALRTSRGTLILTKADTVWAWGSQSQLRAVFGEQLQSISLREVPRNIRAAENYHLKGFFERALALSLCRGRPLLTRNRNFCAHLIVHSNPSVPSDLAPLSDIVGNTSGVVPGLFGPPTPRNPKTHQVQWAESLRVSVCETNERLWILIQPDIWIWPPKFRSNSRDFIDRRRRDRRNKKYNDLLNAWISIALGPHARGAELSVSPFNTGHGADNPEFRVGSRTAFTRRLSQ